ncbi:uncharacterized protein TNIN_323361 [Trichonephila inaurata madagascariensis]|uniref:Uncharacterized protein n=1 Tax=Trichonephila inaurata madagascariensis TaxID=2747483 RepID=A0A8X7BPZ6_9ARAC|nr:uncharacterized protein TNIN_323361 [Trichonephila inaurata madagascariensis]
MVPITATETEDRVKNIHFCMNRYSGSQMQFSDAVQYCGYFAEHTQFGKTIRHKQRISNYNPLEYTYDYYTDKTCSHTKYTPGVYGPATITYVGRNAWVIARCILDTSRLNERQTIELLQACCYL